MYMGNNPNQPHLNNIDAQGTSAYTISNKEKELEDRIEKLEDLVNKLISEFMPEYKV